MKNKFVFLMPIFLLPILFLLSLSFCEEEDANANKIISVSLDEVSRIALENNLDIQIAKYDAYIKRNDLLSAESIFDTIFTASASYKNDQKKTNSSSLFGTKTQTNDYRIGFEKKIPSGTIIGLDLQDTRTATNSPFASINPSHDASAKISITQPIGKNFFGLTDRGNIKITELDIVNSDYTSLERIENSLADVQRAYWKLVYLHQEVKIKKDMLERAERLFSIYEDKYQVGLVEDPDLFASHANVLARENDLLTSQQALILAKNDLLFKLNEEDISLDIHPKDTLVLMDTRFALDDALSKAIENRRDYSKAKNDVISKDINLAMKKNNLWPEIDLKATFTKNGISSSYSKAISGIVSEDNPETYLGLTIRMPLENRNARSQLNKADLEKAKYIVLLKRLERKILTEVNDSVTNLNSLIEQIKTKEKIVVLQEKKLKAEELKLQTGRSNSDIIIRYQQDLLDAELGLASSIYQYNLAKIDLRLVQHLLLNQYTRQGLL